MSLPVENLRIRRTRKLLRDALVELIEERGFDRLTVGEICERAMVSRAAFYRNYRDKFQLVEQIFEEAIGTLLGSIADDGTQPAQERWVGFFEHIDQYHRLYRALLGRSGSPWFANTMRQTLADMVTEHLPLPNSPTAPASAELVPTVLAAMFVQSITWWLEHDRPTPPRAIATQSAQLASAVIAQAHKWNQTPPAPEAPRPGALT